MSSRDLNPEEVTRYPDLVKHEIAYDAVVMIVNSANMVSNLSLAQIKGIYNGTYTNWKQVGV
jgi:phosphate transport system substrate-binding protein